MKQALRVRTEGLRKAEELSISVFLRFVGQSEKATWSLSHSGEAELVLQALDAPAAPAGAARLVWVADPDAPAPADGKTLLRRPLQVEVFGALLRGHEEGIAAAAQAIQPRAAVPRQAAAEMQATYRLTRWPGDDLLQNQRQRKILASFLISRPLSVAQLTALSGVGREACTAFLRELADRQLLESRNPPALAAGEAASAPPPAALAAGGLIGRLRKRLGLA
ncbi:MAG TPA: hypothetical protein VGN52_02390 [Burkholderiales bacterium]|jgi:hypothetical protein